MNALSQRSKQKIITACSVLAIGLMTLGCTPKASEVGGVMKEMKQSYKSAMDSTNIDDFATYAAQLESQAKKASALSYKDKPAVYSDGMQELQQGMIELKAAVDAKDLDRAKAALKKIDETKRKYHKAIDA